MGAKGNEGYDLYRTGNAASLSESGPHSEHPQPMPDSAIFGRVGLLEADPKSETKLRTGSFLHYHG